MEKAHCLAIMESLEDASWRIEMPTLLDCLRGDIYSLLSKMDLPEDQKVQIGKLIEQIRVEENKFEKDIQEQVRSKTSATLKEMNSLRETCSKLEKELADTKTTSPTRAVGDELIQRGSKRSVLSND